ncbi:hypothetical protein DOTSEDRAFT_72100 [Dothistroma septosporum NZE10]|uniref:U3 small nucleolar ribonucleoprotein protein MPP10 n=1 Tax=Dothistroma septosporum (strain NZE10 / CBS 128990) TaxID=675120 RepID=N1PMB2_DOTSN|nr:hypothetical protein DOTSEDRAFT_72100 [Dothistroma septosporum NZE10]
MATSSELLTSLSSRPYEFLQPTLPLYTDAVAYLKHILDPVAKDVATQQQERLKEARKKRKRRGEERDEEEVLRLKQIHVDGFGVEQIWEQARRVIDAAREEAQRDYAEWTKKPEAKIGEKVDLADQSMFDEDDLEDEDLGVEGKDYEVEGVDSGEEMYEQSDASGDDEKDQILEDDDEDIDMDGHDDFDEMEEDGDAEEEHPVEDFVADKFGLNDGFFSIDDFNRQSEFLEQRDVRGEDDGAASDEEDIDWTADPTQVVATVDAEDAARGADEDEEDGPTFADPDAESEDEDEEVEEGELDGMGGMANTNDVMYKDFFAPPAQEKSKKNKKGRPNPHNFPASSALKPQNDEEREEDMQRTMEAVHRDLFDESEEERDEHDEEQDPADPRSRRSAHERRKAAIAEEIRKLEAANVAKRDWQLSGEARAIDRPVNSLLEEDLEFERAGKPVPVITAEVSESIEELIKRRILTHDFQDIPRRRPDDLATGKDGKRGRLDFELDNNKSKKGLAEEYEEEYSKRTDPNYVDIKDETLEKEHKEIEALWRDVCGQLDSLSSWNFRPKQAAPQMDIRVDAPTITLEDARPNAGGEVTTSQLAPQEVYKAGEASNKKEEVVGKSGLPKAREEMDRDERKRRRRREKERIRKAGTNEGPEMQSKKTKEKNSVIGNLKKGNVKVIGKKGTLTDVEGRNAGGEGSGQGAGQYKL